MIWINEEFEERANKLMKDYRADKITTRKYWIEWKKLCKEEEAYKRSMGLM